jgi:hypothetical protein
MEFSEVAEKAREEARGAARGASDGTMRAYFSDWSYYGFDAVEAFVWPDGEAYRAILCADDSRLFEWAFEKRTDAEEFALLFVRQ